MRCMRFAIVSLVSTFILNVVPCADCTSIYITKLQWNVAPCWIQ